MALPFLQPPRQLRNGLFPRLNLDCPMPDEADIWSCALTLERDFNLMIGDPLS